MIAAIFRALNERTFILLSACLLTSAACLSGLSPAMDPRWMCAVLAALGITSLGMAEVVRTRRFHRREDKLYAILDAVPHILFFKDRHFRYQSINAEFERMFRVDMDAAIGKDDSELFGPDLFDRFRAQDRELLSSGESRTYDEDILIDGVPRHIQSRKRPVYDRRGKLHGLVGVTIDVTEQKLLQHRLQEANARLDMALEGARMGTWEWNVTTGEVHADPRARKILGLADGAHDLSSVFARVHPEDVDAIKGRMATSRSRRQMAAVEFRVVDDAGAERWVEGFASPDRLRAGKVYVVGVNRDITERRTRELELAAARRDLAAKAEEARSAVEAKRGFLAMMSHEVRTPLNGMLGMIELVLDGHLAEAQRTMLERCRESSMELLTIINDLLDYSKIRARKLDIENRPLRLTALIEDVCANFTAEMLRKSASLSFSVDARLPAHIIGDPVRLRQVLMNLVGNAVKFTERGFVKVEARKRPGGLLELTVEDTGIGIAPEAMGTLFDAFTQADISTTRRYGGTGLGLTIVKQLVDLMQGRVECESEAGRGSRFTVTLPLHPCEVDTDPAEEAGPPDDVAQGEIVPVARGTRLLLAEDHPVNREVITRQLAKLGFACDCAEDGEDAWERLMSPDARYAMLLTDCRMPRLDGYELTRRLRNHEARLALPRLPIIALTANALEGDAERCIALGMDAYLPKPLQIRDLRDALIEILQLERPVADAASVTFEASQAVTSGPVLGYSTLARLCRGNAPDIAELLRTFAVATSKDLQAFDRATLAGDLSTLQQLAHRLRSGCRQLDETEAVASLQAVERLEEIDEAIIAAARTDLESALTRATHAYEDAANQQFSPCSRE
ncbi:ATP-binding protein [Variovorax sp. GT1P44]|uniref:ATP-binding protein n=1 Tax=Variovorax sp. GT1P44 TaxID=3443742 RepID=UPI003F46009C